MRIWENRVCGVILWPLSVVYGWGVKLRNRLYAGGVLPSVRPGAKVISVGNLTVGGTGKTPLVERLARILQEGGYHVAVLSRGYGRRKKGTAVVSDGHRIQATPEEAGDEPILLAERLRGVPVIVGKDRVKSGRLAIENWGSGVLLLDDGFQHRRIKRDLDLMVLDVTRPWGNRRLLPAGPLREPLSSLQRADVIVFTRIDEPIDVERQISRVREFTDIPILLARHRPLKWISSLDAKAYPLECLKGKRILGFAGIGNPKAFQKSLEALGVETVQFLRYRDHHWYTRKDVKKIIQKAEEKGAEAVVTTEKDSVRLPAQTECGFPMYYLRIEIDIEGGIDELRRMLDSIFES